MIMGYLKGFPQLKLRSNVNGDELSPFINGDRLIYVSPDVSPPLPRETIIGVKSGTLHKTIFARGVPLMVIAQMMWTCVRHLIPIVL